jgi:hypothetical protein
MRRRVPFWMNDGGGLLSSDGAETYYVGLIDCFTHWGLKKQIERVKGSGISSVNPKAYYDRFIEAAQSHYMQSDAEERETRRAAVRPHHPTRATKRQMTAKRY